MAADLRKSSGLGEAEPGFRGVKGAHDNLLVMSRG